MHCLRLNSIRLQILLNSPAQSAKFSFFMFHKSWFWCVVCALLETRDSRIEWVDIILPALWGYLRPFFLQFTFLQIESFEAIFFFFLIFFNPYFYILAILGFWHVSFQLSLMGQKLPTALWNSYFLAKFLLVSYEFWQCSWYEVVHWFLYWVW